MRVPRAPVNTIRLATLRGVPGFVCSDPAGPGFFLSERGAGLTEWSIPDGPCEIVSRNGLRNAGDLRGPRRTTIFVTDWPCQRSSVGIVMASMLSVTCPRFQPTWAMRTSLTLIGI